MEARSNCDIYWNNVHNVPIEILGDSTLKINEVDYNISTSFQKVFTDTTEKPLKKLSDFDRVMIKNFSSSLKINDYIPRPGEPKPARYEKTKSSLDGHVNKILNRSLQCESECDDLEGQGIKKIIIPSNIYKNYTRLENLLGLKLSRHTDTLTEASNLIDELCKRGEIQHEQQYQNALDKISYKLNGTSK